MSGNNGTSSSTINLSGIITPDPEGNVPPGAFLAGPIGTAASAISEWRYLTNYDLPKAQGFSISKDTLGNITNIFYDDGTVQNFVSDTLGNYVTITTSAPLGQTEIQVLNYSTLGDLTSISVSYE